MIERRWGGWFIPKVASFVVGCFAGLLLLEAILRLYGASFSTVPPRTAVAPDAYSVLCLGDSFVYGLGAPRDKSFPSQLEELLRTQSGSMHYVVYNRGVPGQNSSELLDSLQKNIDETKPRIIVILTGGGNTWNYTGYYSYRKGRQAPVKIREALTEIRVFKLIKLLAKSVREHGSGFGSGRSENSVEPPASAIHCTKAGKLYHDEASRHKAEGRIEAAVNAFKKGIEADPKCAANYAGAAQIFFEQEQFKQAEEYYIKAMAVDPLNVDSESYANLGRAYFRLGDHAKALATFQAGIEAHPENLSNYLTYQGLGIIIEYCSDRALRKKIVSFLENLRDCRHVKNPQLDDILALIADNQEGELFEINKWIADDLEVIFRTCADQHIKVILMNYPSHSAVNALLGTVAREHSIPFIDTYEAFTGLLSHSPREAYFAPDRHCNARGYGVMARKVSDKMRELGCVF